MLPMEVKQYAERLSERLMTERTEHII